ncbi:hypothetical protein ABPG77_003850 [Micractinium sp. CCAP 211/92]
MVQVTVRVAFGATIREGSTVQELVVDAMPDDSVLDLKQRVAAAAGGAVTADDLLLEFGPNDRRLGRQYAKDPSVDESQLKLSQYSLLAWLERFPHWKVTVRLLPPTPLPPGVAIHRAAATAEQKNPDQAVADARARGEIPKISDLPAPWGPQPLVQPPREELDKAGYLPPRYPEEWSPLKDVNV